MKRTRAEALVLVNWKGVFYERYLLDPQVTALEGANGAGKTTVMIAAYLVLLPDMQRLRFSNLGETAAIGGDRGIYGRLGEEGRPSYAAIEFRLGSGERLVAGVRLDRKAEPSVELSPFLITGLGDDVLLQALFLDRVGDEDQVPLPAQLRQLVAAQGGALQELKAKDYFDQLFQRGINPLRLTTDGERTKYNEMLKTSMVGGISRTLTGGLRDFLLKEEHSLADNLKMMRENLEACRKTRSQVDAASRLEGEIRGVFEAGLEMVGAALHAARLRADENDAKAAEARARLEEAEAKARTLEEEHRRLDARAEQARVELARISTAVEAARQELDRVRRAHEILRRLEGLDEERRPLAARATELDQAAGLARQALEQARRERDEASSARDEAARGLAEFRQGYELLERRAAEHRRAVRELERARSHFTDLAPEREALAEARLAGQARAATLDEERIRLTTRIAGVEAHRRDFAAALDALSRIEGLALEPEQAWERAHAALARLRELDLLREELPSLPAQLERAEARRERRLRLEERLAVLAVPATAPAVQEAFDGAESDVAGAARQQREAEAARDLARRVEAEAAERIRILEGEKGRWLACRQEARALEERWDVALDSQDDLLALQRQLSVRRDEEREALREVERRHLSLQEELRQLEMGSGGFEPRLLEARDAVEGQLLAGHFEEVPVDEAARIEALLGPLHEALVVDDVRAAAERLIALPQRPDSVWLVDRDADLGLEVERDRSGLQLNGAVLVGTGAAHRLTRLPAQPRLGRKARERRIAGLRTDVENAGGEVAEGRSRLHALDAAVEGIAVLLPRAAMLERPDPEGEIAIEVRRRDEAAAARRACETKAQRAQREGDAARTRRDALLAALPEAHLLEEQDPAAAVAPLEKRLEAARAADAELRRIADDRRSLQERLELLRTPPPSAQTCAAMQQEADRLLDAREQLEGPLEALRYVQEHLVALGWAHVEEELSRQERLAPALQRQFEEAETELRTAVEAHDAADDRFERARRDQLEAQGALEAIDKDRERTRAELEQTGVTDASGAAVTAAEERHGGLLQARDEAAAGSQRAAEDRVRCDTLLEQQRRQIEAQAEVVEAAERLARPTRASWQRLEALARDEGVLQRVSTEAVLEAQGVRRGSPTLWSRSSEAVARLAERLRLAAGGDALAQRLQGFRSNGLEQQGAADACFDLWLQVRAWLAERVPAQVSEGDDPLEALQRLGERLASLRERLTQQEHDLRGRSESVARQIEVLIRRARAEVNRLNHDLGRVSFGSIRGVKIRVQRVERMEKVLEALRSGSAQGLLFGTDLPVEEALDELFRHYGGGKTGGHRLLDYREYLSLVIEVRRQASEGWEAANPNRMSTGEAIGVGAALMMVVLTAWERDSSLFRAKRSWGTLRFLFLDEATRLSPDSLAILFDLCQSLQMQLLIAAPEVEHAAGNTTYRLVRQLDAEQREVVLVTGRRSIRAEA